MTFSRGKYLLPALCYAPARSPDTMTRVIDWDSLTAAKAERDRIKALCSRCRIRPRTGSGYCQSCKREYDRVRRAAGCHGCGEAGRLEQVWLCATCVARDVSRPQSADVSLVERATQSASAQLPAHPNADGSARPCSPNAPDARGASASCDHIPRP